MGIVIKQSFLNSINSYVGIALGAFNTIFFFPFVFAEQPEFMGEIQTMLALATVISTFAHFGLPVSLVTYFPRFNEQQREAFWRFALFLAFGSSLLLALLALLWPLWGGVDFERQGALLVSISMLLYELFAALAQFHGSVIFSQFIKNVFRRLIVLAALITAYFSEDKQLYFYWVFAGGYLLHLALMVVSARKLWPKLRSSLSNLALREISTYGIFVMLASGAVLLVSKIDVLMIRRLLGKEEVAFYSIAFFIGSVVSVPVRSIIVSIRPILSKAYARGDWEEITSLYRKSAIAQLSLTALALLLIWANLPLLFYFQQEQYQFAGAHWVVLLIAFGEVVAGATGANGLILTVSNLQRYNFYTGLVLILLTVLGNLLLIPALGLVGAALASAIALSLFNIIKTIIVNRSFSIQPFSKSYWRVFALFLISLATLVYLRLSMPSIWWFVGSANVVVGSLLVFVWFKVGGMHGFKKMLA